MLRMPILRDLGYMVAKGVRKIYLIKLGEGKNSVLVGGIVSYG